MTKNTIRIILDVVPELHALLTELYRQYTSERMNGITFNAFCKDLLSEVAKSKLSGSEQQRVASRVDTAVAEATQRDRKAIEEKAKLKVLTKQTAEIEERFKLESKKASTIKTWIALYEAQDKNAQSAKEFQDFEEQVRKEGHDPRHMREQYEAMTPEQRLQFLVMLDPKA